MGRLLRLDGSARRAVLVLLIAAVVATGWAVFRAWGSWQNVERVSFDTDKARAGLGADRVTTTTLADTPAIPAIELPHETVSVLIVGSDQRSEDDLSRRADVIMVFVLPGAGGDPMLFSIPRDLWLPNPCTGGMSRVNANLNGCGDLATGPEQLAVAVEDFTGIEISHFAVFDFDGFEMVIDRVGGVEICTDVAVRDHGSGLALPAGCTRASGAQALAWVRSRRTQELVGGTWRTMPGVNDLTRNERQQEIVLRAIARLKDFRNIGELSGLVDDVANAVTIDDGLSLSEAVSLAWNLRSLDLDRIIRFVIPTVSMLGPGGEAALRPTEPFSETLQRATDVAALIVDA
jgi:LCP family protein required for cell wall assembly